MIPLTTGRVRAALGHTGLSCHPLGAQGLSLGGEPSEGRNVVSLQPLSWNRSGHTWEALGKRAWPRRGRMRSPRLRPRGPEGPLLSSDRPGAHEHVSAQLPLAEYKQLHTL